MIQFIFVGKFRNDFVKEGFHEYYKRLSRFTKTELIEVKETDVERIQSLAKHEMVVLDVEGTMMDSVQLASFIKDRDLSIVIGGPEGLPCHIRDAGQKISMSLMTFPHLLIRLMLVEQVYRALTINKGMSYHK